MEYLDVFNYELIGMVVVYFTLMILTLISVWLFFDCFLLRVCRAIGIHIDFVTFLIQRKEFNEFLKSKKNYEEK